jgi:hypothetical protein
MNPLVASGLFIMLTAVLSWIMMPDYMGWDRRVLLRQRDYKANPTLIKVGRAISVATGIFGLVVVVVGLFFG